MSRIERSGLSGYEVQGIAGSRVQVLGFGVEGRSA